MNVLHPRHFVLTHICAQILISFIQRWDHQADQTLPRAALEKSVFQTRSSSKSLDAQRAEENKRKDYRERRKTRKRQKTGEEEEEGEFESGLQWLLQTGGQRQKKKKADKE